MCCNVILLSLGIIILVKGHVLLTRTKEVRGTPARIIGVLLLLPLPLSFFAGLLLGAFYVWQGKPIVNRADIQGPAAILGVAIIVLCLLAAIAVGVAYARPVRKNRIEDEDEEGIVPDRYHEHFQAEEEGQHGPRSDSQDVTGRPPRPPAGPDDRIRD